MTTSNTQISLFTEEELTSSREAFRANRTQTQENDLGKQTQDISGRKCLEQYARFDQHSLWGKTFVASLIGTGEWSSKRCALTWKMKAMKSYRLWFQLVPSVRRTEETEFGLLLKTPTKMDGEVSSGKAYPVSGNSGSLAQEIMSEYPPTMEKLGLIPTLKARMPSDCPSERRWHTPSLESLAAMGMLPTPTAHHQNAGTEKPRKNGKSREDELNHLVSIHAGKSSQLNPLFVAEMMGFPVDWTVLPFTQKQDKPSS